MDLNPIRATELKPPLNVRCVRDQAGIAQLVEFLSKNPIFGFDIETDPKKDFFYRRCRTWQFGNKEEQYVVDLLALCNGDSNLLYHSQGYYGINLCDGLKQFIAAVSPFLCSRDFLKVGVNLGFEYLNLYWLFGLRTCNFFDNAVVERCIWAGAHSLKDYGFYSMEEMMARYFQVQIDKSLQESFTLDVELSTEQIAYAALDTRFPLALRELQMLILQGHTYQTLKDRKHPGANYIKQIDPIVLGDNLTEVAQIENDAIGAFQDMHCHGERLDSQRWLERVAKRQKQLKELIAEKLDPVFLPIVGSKYDMPTDVQIATAEAEWKSLNEVSDAELKLKVEIRQAKKTQPDLAVLLEQRKDALQAERKAEKDRLKELCGTMKKRRTAIKNLAADCEGEALINYSSRAQVLAQFHKMKGLAALKDTEDESLAKFANVPVVAAFREYRTLAKEIGTYGEKWVTEWVTGPCKDEGWLHPGDHRLHCVFNQYDAETGRSSSERPNGQNLPRDKDTRACFIADPADESIRISVCCDAETEFKFNNANGAYVCSQCRAICETKPEEYVIITADMSGAELRILAELANESVWVDAFKRGEDVHAVCTELIEGEHWRELAAKGGEIITDARGKIKVLKPCSYFTLHTAETVAKNPHCVIGEPMRQKCDCPAHNELRNNMKPTNFGIPYGISAVALAPQIGKSKDETQELMDKHRARFAKLWGYVDESGRLAKMLKKAFDMFGRRRIFPAPDWDRAKEKAKEDKEERLRFALDEEEAKKRFFKAERRMPTAAELEAIPTQKRNLDMFLQLKGRKPTPEEKWLLLHRLPDQREVANAYAAMHGTIERQGKNHVIQGTNATIAKKAMGCGYCPQGKPYLWHILPQYKAKLLKMVHDELVVQAPKRFAEKVAWEVGDAFRRAAAEKMKRVTMEFDYHIETYWTK